MRMRMRNAEALRGKDECQEGQQKNAEFHGRHNITDCGIKVARYMIAVTRLL